MERFQELTLRIERRARLVRGLEAARLPLAAALLVTLGYEVLQFLGLVGGIRAHWLVALNLGVALGGFLWGYLRRVDLGLVLFRADRKLGLHERLSALYGLCRGRGRAEFIPLISARLPPRIEPARAIPLVERRGWLLPAALLLAILILGSAHHAPFVRPPLAEERLAQEQAESLPPRLAALEEKLAELEEAISALGHERRPELPEAGAEARALQEELEEELWGSPADQRLQGEVLERLAQAASSLAESGEGGRPSPAWAQLEAELKQLASRLRGGALKELLQQLPKAGAGTSLQNLAAAQALAQRLAAAEEKLQEYEQLTGQAARSGGGDEEGRGSSLGGEGEGDQPAEEGPPGGEEAGTTRGAWPEGEPLPLSWPSGLKEFHIAGELGEWGPVEQLLTKGTPFEASGSEAFPSLQLNFQRVIAILESREVSPELEEAVKRYFLMITEER